MSVMNQWECPLFFKKMASSHSRFAFSLFFIHTHTHISAHVSKEHESLCSNNKPYEFVKELIKTRSRQDPYMWDYYALKKVREARWVPLQRQALQSGKEVNEAMSRLNPHSKEGAWHPLKSTSYKIVKGPIKKGGRGKGGGQWCTFIPETLQNSEWAYESKASVKHYKLTHDTFIKR